MFTAADELDAATMQLLAREMNLSERAQAFQRIGRPSTLHARVFGSAERLERVEVGGQAVVMGRGEITLPS